MKENFKVYKNILSKETSYISCRYLFLKKQVLKTLKEENYISPLSTEWGVFGDKQVPNVYCCYGDILMEVFLAELLPFLQKKLKKELFPTYSYVRIYEKGSILKKHLDRDSCELSTTINLGGDLWPIFLKEKGKTHKIILHPGDMLVYKGCILEHWRKKFTGNICYQAFMHYNFLKSDPDKKNLFDKRKHLGLPCDLKQ